MKVSSDSSKIVNRIVIILIFLIVVTCKGMSQDYRFNVSVDPFITWFGSDVDSVRNEGSRAGFDLIFSCERSLTANIFMTGGISFANTSGRLKNSHPVRLKLPGSDPYVSANSTVVYKIQYFSVPIGFKFSTNPMRNYTLFGEIGLDPEVVIRGRIDVPSLKLSNARAMTEINRFNMGWYVNGGATYYISDSFSLALGIGFENNFADVTKDVGSQGTDKISQRFIKFIFGANFQLFQ
jgi:hypothetical protein